MKIKSMVAAVYCWSESNKILFRYKASSDKVENVKRFVTMVMISVPVCFPSSN